MLSNGASCSNGRCWNRKEPGYIGQALLLGRVSAPYSFTGRWWTFPGDAGGSQFIGQPGRIGAIGGGQGVEQGGGGGVTVVSAGGVSKETQISRQRL